MKRKQVWRYYCEFCKKSNCSASSISRHENHCTLNPDRKCRMCERAGLAQQPLSELISLLSSCEMVSVPLRHEIGGGDYLEIKGDIKKAMQDLEDATEGCPACTLAAIRQSGILVPLTGYNFTKALELFWGNVNEWEREY